jgi:beta-aspartyl-peptidase (threonine type)
MSVTNAWGGEATGWAILVHGGAGSVPADRRTAHAEGCKRAAELGAEILKDGGSALDAAQRAAQALEDDPKYNAGTGACLNEDGKMELDASIMCGATLRAGAVGAMPPFKNPILVARRVLEDGKHVFYVAEGAERFAKQNGFTPATLEEMLTETSRQHWERVRAEGKVAGFAGGTIGAVARDAAGHVAAATSTGGTTNKRVGRIGDTPILGAGTWADDGCGAASATGVGEAMMRTCLCKVAADWMRDGSFPEDVAKRAIKHLLERTGGTGGLILMGPKRHLGIARSTDSMSWGAMADGWDAARCGV